MDSDDEMAARAVAAMEALGLPKKFVLGVLSRSLKAYDGAWGFLAQDHFQILADICFTEMETETVSIERGVSVKCAASKESGRSKAESSSRTRALPAPRPAEVRAARTNVAAVRALPCSTALLPPPAPRPAPRPAPPTAPMPAPKPPVFKVPPSRPRPLQRSSPARKNGTGELEPFILKAFNGISPFGDFPHHLLLPPPNGHEREPPPSHSRCRPLRVEPLAVNELHLPLSTPADANKQLAIVPQTAVDTALAIVPRTAETISSPSFGVLALLSQYGDGGDN